MPERMGDESARSVEEKGFGWLLLAVSIGFALVVWPLFGAVLWASVFAIVCAPLFRWLKRAFRGRGSLAAATTLVLVIVVVIVPMTLVTAAIVREATAVYERVRANDIGVGEYLQRGFDSLPPWMTSLLERFGLADLGAVQERLTAGLAQASQLIAKQAISIGQNTLEFLVSLGVMLYLLFFLLRDGEAIYRRLHAAVPLRRDRRRALFEKFAVVVRATVKGNLVVAIVQGALGGLIFWILGLKGALLWAVIMALLSLLPAIGTAMVWLPVAIYFLATGAVVSGVVLILFGVFVIGLVDNVLRPVLVGKDTRMPDYVVLVATLGGIALFGPNGFVLGPLIAALFMAAWDLFATSRTDADA
jgi:predicted PurR-regulated permease PerM